MNEMRLVMLTHRGAVVVLLILTLNLSFSEGKGIGVDTLALVSGFPEGKMWICPCFHMAAFRALYLPVFL